VVGLTLNAHFPAIPPGTLAANLIGGYVVGSRGFFATYSAVAPEWRLLVITGFCGGLTTFSTFSAEVVTLMQQGRALWALGAAAAHLRIDLMTLPASARWPGYAAEHAMQGFLPWPASAGTPLSVARPSGARYCQRHGARAATLAGRLRERRGADIP